MTSVRSVIGSTTGVKRSSPPVALSFRYRAAGLTPPATNRSCRPSSSQSNTATPPPTKKLEVAVVDVLDTGGGGVVDEAGWACRRWHVVDQDTDDTESDGGRDRRPGGDPGQQPPGTAALAADAHRSPHPPVAGTR